MMRLILGVIFSLVSNFSFAATGECIIEGYAQKNYGNQSAYRFLNQVELTSLSGCQSKLERTVQALEKCMMIPAGRVSHVQMVFNGAEKQKSVEYINANCGELY